MKDYFKLQLVMTNRKIKESGINPILGYLLALITFVLLAEYIFQKTEFAKYVLILGCLSLQLKLSEKDRTDFLLSTFGDKVKNIIRILENTSACIPFVSILVYKNFIFEAGILLICSNIFALFSIHNNVNLTIPTPFSKRPFEFSTGFRKTFVIFLLAYILTFFAIKVDNLNLGIFSFLLVFLTSLSYYSKPEDEYYIWVHADTPASFLKSKVLNASKNAALLTAPIIISLLLFYPVEVKMMFLFFLIGMLFLWTIILAKYSAYPSDMNLPDGLLIAFSFSFPPLLLAIIPFFYTKSINKLKILLND